MKKIKDIEEIEHENTDEIICPWCGEEVLDSQEWENNAGYGTCDECGKQFNYVRDIEVTYSTTRKKCEKCEYELEDKGFNNPDIHHGKNFCIWVCKKCNDEIIKTGRIAQDNKPYVIPID